MSKKRIFRRSMAFLLCLCTIMYMVPVDIGTTDKKTEVTKTADAAVTQVTEVPEGYTGIYDVEDLNAIGNNLTGKYILMADIDLTEVTNPETGEWSSGGNGWWPIGLNTATTSLGFSGTFNGNNHTIKGMQIKNRNFMGLFANIDGGTVSNLNLEEIDFSGSVSSGETNIGGVCGVFLSGTIYGCRVSGEINVSNTSTSNNYVGGIVGGSNTEENKSRSLYSNLSSVDTTVSGNVCYVGGIIGRLYCKDIGISIHKLGNSGNINVTQRSYSFVGGIIGEFNAYLDSRGVYTSKIYDTFNKGNISGTASFVGGIIGMGNGRSFFNDGHTYYNDLNISLSYNSGTITGSTYNSVIATIGLRVAIEKCYYLDSTGTQIDGTYPLTETQMKTASAYTGFNFNSTWFIDPIDDYKYPQLVSMPLSVMDTIELDSTELKKSYFTGDKIDLTGGKLTAYFMDNTSITFDITEDMVSGYDMSTAGIQTVTVTYRGETVTYQINVKEKPALTSLTLVSAPTKTEFVRGTEFDFTGCQALAVYADSTSEVLNIDVEDTTGGNIDTSGTQTITYTHDGASVTFEVKVVPVKATSLELTSLPTKTSYIEGMATKLDTTGIAANV
ncbi:MAG: bacterial Ig-like domain-containing protein, partial [Lachnospiraceae bacterium]|nr:bacterial Ig-like domain-containing protein [Lachnospiraceae bacterium]